MNTSLTRIQKLKIRTHNVKILKQVAEKNPQYALFTLQHATENVDDGYDIAHFTNAVISVSGIIKRITDTLNHDSGLADANISKHGIEDSTYTDIPEVNYDCNALKKVLDFSIKHNCDYITTNYGTGFQVVRTEDADQAIDDLSKYLLIPLVLKDGRVTLKKDSLEHFVALADN